MKSSRFSIGISFVLILYGGCAPKRTAEDFVPTEATAEATLEQALAAWKGGAPLGRVQESGPAIELVDRQVKPGQKLVAYTILGPTSGNAQRCYAVRLTFDHPREEVRARFAVFGLDPLWVIRHEDLDMTLHWDHPPEPTSPAKKPSP